MSKHVKHASEKGRIALFHHIATEALPKRGLDLCLRE
jgi:hypothetical protein